MKFVKKQHLIFDGPQTFEELKKRILDKEIFDINIRADVLDKVEEKSNDNNKVMKLIRK